MPEISDSRYLPVAVEDAWRVVSDIGGYGRFTSGIRTRIMHGAEAESVRECINFQGRWQEDVVAWEPGSHYSMAVRTKAEDYPFPLRRMQGTWGVKPEGEGTRIWVRFKVVPRGVKGWLWLLGQLGGSSATKDLLDAYEDELLGGRA